MYAAPARALVTGAGGFVGKHLLSHLLDNTGWQIYCATRAQMRDIGDSERVRWIHCDLRDAVHTAALVEQVAPHFVFHLAAQSNVQLAFKDPEGTFTTNLVGQLNLLNALRTSSPQTRTLVACSSEQYGLVRPEDIPIDEDVSFRPNNPYAVSKIAQDAQALQHFLSWGQQTVRVRAFNHIGPGQSEDFVASAFAKQVARIEAGLQEPVLYVGNLEAERDFTDVRDMVKAYLLAVTQGEPGEVYNVGSGKAYTIQSLLDAFLASSKVPIEVRQDPARMRPSDIPVLLCDASKFHRRTGWMPIIPFERTLQDILDYWREKVRSET